ncbi:MAG TPA: NrdH-redoxin [Actinobacteria bacterium]|nr:NrdH-redoxin [Actinomycetota bacterium]
MAAARITLFTRPGCHLCDTAREVVNAVAAECAVGVQEVDITTDPDLLAKYWDKIPVTLVDGQPHDVFFVDAERLRQALTS